LRWLVDTTVLVYSQKENNLPISSTLGLVLWYADVFRIQEVNNSYSIFLSVPDVYFLSGYSLILAVKFNSVVRERTSFTPKKKVHTLHLGNAGPSACCTRTSHCQGKFPLGFF
jgi:hypothetical protein